jgi:DHA2 family methylenomycin A resistance protein-like MFS transporter
MTMCVGMFLVLLDVTIVNVALPSIGTALRTDLAGLQWVVDGYGVPLAGLLLAGGTIGDVAGHKRVVLAGLGLFGAATLGCSAAPNVETLVACRALQGFGAAMLLPATVAVITRAYPERAERARALGLWAGVSSLALPAGPLLGGLLVSSAGWRHRLPHQHPDRGPRARRDGRSRRRFARRSHTAHRRARGGGRGARPAAALLGTIDAGREGFSALTIAVGVASVVAAAALAAIERRSADPALPLSLLRSPGVVGANAVAAAMNTVGIGTVFVLTLYLQTVQGHSATAAGAALVPLFAPLAALSPVTAPCLGSCPQPGAK